MKRAVAKKTNQWVFFCTHTLVWKPLTHQYLRVCVCFSDVNFLVYAWKCVSNTLIRINKLDVARKTNECVIFRTHAMFWKPRTHHMLRVCACFTNVHLVFYAYMFVWNTLSLAYKRTRWNTKFHSIRVFLNPYVVSNTTHTSQLTSMFALYTRQFGYVGVQVFFKHTYAYK